jgi:drug/metabolite transporter (DMT)-like permease
VLRSHVVDRQLRLAYVAWVMVCVVWGTTYLGIRIALESIPPMLVGGLRFTIAGGILAAVLRLRGYPLPHPREWPGLAMLGCLMLGVGNGGVVWAEQTVPSGIAAVLVAAQPFWITGIEGLLPAGERLTPRAFGGLLVGFAGIVVLVWPDLRTGGEWSGAFVAGVLATQFACVGWSIGSSWSKRRPSEENAIMASALQMIFGGLCLLVAATVRGEWHDLAFTPRSLGAELYLIVVGSWAGYSAYIYALKHLPITTVMLYSYINPVIAVLLGTVVLSEPFGLRVIAASAVVLAGVAIVRARR